jgi:hypothetical protein
MLLPAAKIPVKGHLQGSRDKFAPKPSVGLKAVPAKNPWLIREKPVGETPRDQWGPPEERMILSSQCLINIESIEKPSSFGVHASPCRAKVRVACVAERLNQRRLFTRRKPRARASRKARLQSKKELRKGNSPCKSEYNSNPGSTIPKIVDLKRALSFQSRLGLDWGYDSSQTGKIALYLSAVQTDRVRVKYAPGGAWKLLSFRPGYIKTRASVAEFIDHGPKYQGKKISFHPQFLRAWAFGLIGFFADESAAAALDSRAHCFRSIREGYYEVRKPLTISQIKLLASYDALGRVRAVNIFDRIKHAAVTRASPVYLFMRRLLLRERI